MKLIDYKGLDSIHILALHFGNPLRGFLIMDLNIVIILNLIHIFDFVTRLTANAPEY